MKQISNYMALIIILVLEEWVVKPATHRRKASPATSKEQKQPVRKAVKSQNVVQPRSIKLKLMEMQEQIEYLRWFDYEEFDN